MISPAIYGKLVQRRPEKQKVLRQRPSETQTVRFYNHLVDGCRLGGVYDPREVRQTALLLPQRPPRSILSLPERPLALKRGKDCELNQFSLPLTKYIRALACYGTSPTNSSRPVVKTLASMCKNRRRFNYQQERNAKNTRLSEPEVRLGSLSGQVGRINWVDRQRKKRCQLKPGVRTRFVHANNNRFTREQLGCYYNNYCKIIDQPARCT